MIDRLAEVTSDYDAIVFDQWGVLHNGSLPYPQAADCVAHLRASSKPLAVLSNSGKRAAPNAARIAAMGFDEAWFDVVMTSGEALWSDVTAGRIAETAFLPVEAAPGDAARWANGLSITLVSQLEAAEAVLLMGLADGVTLEVFDSLLNDALARNLTIYCTNPDRASPRATGLVVSPGALAFAYLDRGGAVRFYGKPHQPIFEALSQSLESSRLLMVGDSLEHDIAGAHAAGWDSLLIQGGLYAEDFATGDPNTLARLMAEKSAPAPTYMMDMLS